MYEIKTEEILKAQNNDKQAKTECVCFNQKD